MRDFSGESDSGAAGDFRWSKWGWMCRIATVMLIENAEQFGAGRSFISLRGRIGRGAQAGVLHIDSGKRGKKLQHPTSNIQRSSKTSNSKLQNCLGAAEDFWKRRANGFEISGRADFENSGGRGSCWGRSRVGCRGLRFGDLVKDFDLVVKAKRVREPERITAAKIPKRQAPTSRENTKHQSSKEDGRLRVAGRRTGNHECTRIKH